MSTINVSNLKNPNSTSNNIVLAADGSTTIATLNVTNLKNPSSGSNNIVLAADGSATAPSLVPPGTIQFYAANTAPLGWVKANGAALSRSTYASLFAAIGTTFGVGDGSTTFDLPDMRGEFPRGWDDGRGIDSGRAFGSAQADALKSHSHTIATKATVLSGGADEPPLDSTGGAVSYPTSSTGGAETRPRNIALLAIIKF
jgi:microcystin-dependent protein